MNTRKVIAGALSASLLVGALPGLALAQDDTSEITPEGVEWMLSTLAGEPVPEPLEITLFLSGGEVVGNAGCNSYFGSYELDGDALTFPNPFGVTLRLCEDAVMAIEDAYLPLLQETATFAFDDEGALNLADADGTVQLAYFEAPVDITASNVDALVATLGDLQDQVDEATEEVAALAERAASIPVDQFDKRVTQNEEDIAQLQSQVGGVNVKGLRDRVVALEEEVASQSQKIADINLTINKLRDRIRVLEATDEDHEARLTALESAP